MMKFTFTGPEGMLTDPEPLTSGMVGKTVWLEFDDAWSDLDRRVVFTAGDVTRQVLMAHNITEIPAEVLERPWYRLLVGVQGIDSTGTLVLPSQMVAGPMITQGADPEADPALGG